MRTDYFHCAFLSFLLIFGGCRCQLYENGAENISFCVPPMKESQTGLKQHKSEHCAVRLHQICIFPWHIQSLPSSLQSERIWSLSTAAFSWYLRMETTEIKPVVLWRTLDKRRRREAVDFARGRRREMRRKKKREREQDKD